MSIARPLIHYEIAAFHPPPRRCLIFREAKANDTGPVMGPDIPFHSSPIQMTPFPIILVSLLALAPQGQLRIISNLNLRRP